jgi:hypothetical protein
MTSVILRFASSDRWESSEKPCRHTVLSQSERHLKTFHHRKARVPATNCTASITFISEVKSAHSNVRIADHSKSNVLQRHCRLTATTAFPSLNFQIGRGHCFFHSSSGSRTLLGSVMEEAAAAALTPRIHSFDRDRHLCSFGSSDRPRPPLRSICRLAGAGATASFTQPPDRDRGSCFFHSSA